MQLKRSNNKCWQFISTKMIGYYCLMKREKEQMIYDSRLPISEILFISMFACDTLILFYSLSFFPFFIHSLSFNLFYCKATSKIFQQLQLTYGITQQQKNYFTHLWWLRFHMLVSIHTFLPIIPSTLSLLWTESLPKIYILWAHYAHFFTEFRENGNKKLYMCV